MSRLCLNSGLDVVQVCGADSPAAVDSTSVVVFQTQILMSEPFVSFTVNFEEIVSFEYLAQSSSDLSTFFLTPSWSFQLLLLIIVLLFQPCCSFFGFDSSFC